VIRVNLLPQKRKQERAKTAISAPSAGGSKWLLVVLGVVVLEAIGFIIFHNSKLNELAAQVQKNSQLDGQIKNIQAIVTQHEQVKKDLADLRAREDAITQLQAGRTGPTAVLLELAQLLTPGKAPSADPDYIKKIQKENPLQGFNINWDAHRLWLTSYVEDSRTVRIEGFARDSQDVSEFANRLKLSAYFYDVKLLPGKKDKSTTEDGGVVSFGVELKVRY
jgi:type IV pilus assembly protein PilN